MASNVSTLGQQISIINRVKSIQSQMSVYQQQVTTGVKYQNFSDYGADSLRIQRYRSDLASIEGYLYNIDVSQVNIKQMDNSVAETIEQAGNVLSAISIQLSQGSDYDLQSIKDAARAALQMVENNLNSRVGERYLFAGSDVSAKPFTGASVADSNVEARISDWLDGTVTTDAFLTGLSGMTDSQSGFSTSVQSAKSVYARADDGFEVDYSILANGEGFKKIVNSLRAISKLEIPDETTDVPTQEQLHDVVDSLYSTIQEGVQALRADSTRISSSAKSLEIIKENHKSDRQNLQQILESTEAADTTDAVIKFQTLQNQLESSYQITSIISQLSLARFLS